ncbi:heparan sulfate 2-O-sulfotransferase pipe-like isoform X1 [Diabrotica virgifera virgifera]|uniref:Heparan sulfate 2-O-sulfotransferase pipe-like isoform X1 n=1 Tax=Diabrotica virgifera virgifera TaxID=50390 RepID=A0A6P7FKZ2_DIAVI|nr:heparan sulfate 2-O-sulfotransferase pipe-like isoform X1 [Diabrotica virgifera virgifera]XP_028133602.1 heparan sulfate 2-O-sulfotransferase pipe-like isoform X1 [Diabrotica virgifera virgifera]XP_028133603.1 heparan sulfate 2-O-sulfotransferase pipe-like isoform X1 [Diabrotica virgifera virgifera]XP_028133604.1 heparan sulfate 2-O-sulfotransferase pipe-like isoform X1 [Diabrotica virgifera virgifera]XP_050501805.1 heparan sulfate 2-O-sulfotransferase pipe-like isoform X1 [Diabrotica virgif
MRLHCKLQWYSIILFFTIILSASMFFKKEDIGLTKTTPKTTEGALSLANSKHVTKSLTQLGRMDEVNRHLLFLNHVPKCGTEILILLLQKLQGYNNYRHVRLKYGNKRLLSNLQQEHLVYEMYDIMKKEAVPVSLDRHVFFINFTQFGRQFPTYINLIRHPVDKIISRSTDKEVRKDYFYKCLVSKRNGCNFKNGQPYELSIPYFCGHDKLCMILNNDWALQRAKQNVAKYYPVVGVLEELNATLEVFENTIPYFFKGVQKLYQKEFLHLQNNRKKADVPKMVIQQLEDTLINEIEFYEWIKSRLFRQLQILYGEHHNH